MDRSLGAARAATMLAGFDRSPAYAGLARALTELIGDGRIPHGTRLPSERDLTAALGVSRTTVARAYTALREAGYAEARQGAGTFTRVPGGRARRHDRALHPRPGDGDAIDLSCAATTAPPGVAAAYTAAAAELPAYLGGPGYYPAGLPALQEALARSFAERGLPTDPEQVLVTPGALAATAVVARALLSPGDRVLVEAPVYPNAVQALRYGGARLALSPVDPEGWDLAAVGAAVGQAGARLAYLIPDFQNPTGHLMSDRQRARLAADLDRAGTVAVVDEAHQWLPLEGQPMPRPFAAHSPGAITVGSASKGFWGGLRVGWIRAPHEHLERLTDARLGLDLGVPVMEQLAVAQLLADPDATLVPHRARLREQRDRLAAALQARLPEWEFVLPTGGLALWCRLPEALGSAVAEEAERRGVMVAPGPVFAPEGGLGRYLRLPWTRPPAELEDAVDRLAQAWAAVRDRDAPAADRRASRLIVA